jgi:hypothetical protein
MVRRCPPGVFCFENVTLVIVAIIMVGVGIYAHSRFFGGHGGGHHGPHHGYGHGHAHGGVLLESTDPLSASLDFGIGGPSSNQDVLLNPYVPPLRDNSVGATRPSYDIRGGVETIHYGGMDGGGGGGGGALGVRVNVPTRSVDTTYRQVGILTRNGSGNSNGAASQETILPLIGRPLFTNRDKWQFYSLSDKNNAIKLPVIINGKSGTGEYGCNNVSTGDMIYVEGYNDAFRVTAYDSASLRYLPF